MRAIAQFALALFVGLASAPHHAAERSVVLDALQAELKRSMRVLGEQPVPPYYLGYEVIQYDDVSADGSFGTLVASRRDRDRYLDVDLRVGSHALDNTRAIRDDNGSVRRDYSRLPVEDDVAAIRAEIWLETDEHYKNALERFTKVKADVNVKVEAEDTSADFSREKPVKHIGETPGSTVYLADWEAKVRRYTAPFAEHGDIYRADASFSAEIEPAGWQTAKAPGCAPARPATGCRSTPRPRPMTAWRCRCTSPSRRFPKVACRATRRCWARWRG